MWGRVGYCSSNIFGSLKPSTFWRWVSSSRNFIRVVILKKLSFCKCLYFTFHFVRKSFLGLSRKSVSRLAFHLFYTKIWMKSEILFFCWIRNSWDDREDQVAKRRILWDEISKRSFIGPFHSTSLGGWKHMRWFNWVGWIWGSSVVRIVSVRHLISRHGHPSRGRGLLVYLLFPTFKLFQNLPLLINPKKNSVF